MNRTPTIDETYRKAIQIVVYEQSASTSLIQRYCSVGYYKGAAMIERMENEGVISRSDDTGKRRVLWGLTDFQNDESHAGKETDTGHTAK